jgi:hypothetical protein
VVTTYNAVDPELSCPALDDYRSYLLGWMASTMGGRMMRPEGMGGTMNGMMGGGVMMGMMVLTWIFMIGLVGVFIYLIVMALRSRRTVQA